MLHFGGGLRSQVKTDNADDNDGPPPHVWGQQCIPQLRCVSAAADAITLQTRLPRLT